MQLILSVVGCAGRLEQAAAESACGTLAERIARREQVASSRRAFFGQCFREVDENIHRT